MSCSNNTQFVTADQARGCSRDKAVTFGEICAIQQAILAAMDLKQYSTIIADSSAMTLLSDPTTVEYYNTWMNLSTSPEITDQMDTVVTYFQKLNYNIQTQVNTVTSTNIQWKISW